VQPLKLFLETKLHEKSVSFHIILVRRKIVRGNVILLIKNDAVNKKILTFSVVPTDGTLWILETDYENWSATWSCTQIANRIIGEYAWILARDEVISEEDVILQSCKIASNTSTVFEGFFFSLLKLGQFMKEKESTFLR
jgi:hypothetical protein